MKRPTPALLVTLSVVLTACATGEQLGPSPARATRPPARTLHSTTLDSLGLRLARTGWESAGRSALPLAAPMTGSFRERLVFPRDGERALAWRLELSEGQRIEYGVTPDADASPWSLDLFEAVRADSFAVVGTARLPASGGEFTAPRAGTWVLRLQPEPGGGGSYVLSVHGGSPITFPLPGFDVSAIRSPYGSARDGGARAHEGVDIFAPRGTPVLAVTDSWVTAVERTPTGGRVVWARDVARDLLYYYAHLDEQLVKAGTRVSAGDTIGRVGNTGNARSASPHLHFSIYAPGMVALDPTPALAGATLLAPEEGAAIELLGGWAATRGRGVRLRATPALDAAILAELDQGTEVRVLGLVRDWHHVELVDGRMGFIAARLLDSRTLSSH